MQIEKNTLSSLQFVLEQSCFAELKTGDLWLIELKYATEDNFMNENMYHEFNRAFLHLDAVEKLTVAAHELKKLKPNYRFIIYDALRPRSVQWKMWNKVKGTDHQQYIANPESGSNHNFGMAIDLSIVDERDKPLNMGTGFDEFSEMSQPRYEDRYVASQELTSRHIENRKLLKTVMEGAGFKQLSTEWWHFDALAKAEIRARYQIVE
jgi:zinc D-Ala-D-Ala dipeptidase